MACGKAKNYIYNIITANQSFRVDISQKLSSFLSCVYLGVGVIAYATILYLRRIAIKKIALSVFMPSRKKILPDNIPQELFFLAYAILFFALYFMTANKLSWHYLSTVLFFNLIIYAVFLDILYEKQSKLWRLFFYIILAFLLSCGLISTATLIKLPNYGRMFYEKGYDYALLGNSMAKHTYRIVLHKRTVKDVEQFIAKVKPAHQFLFYRFLGVYIGEEVDDIKPNVRDIANTIRPEYQGYFYDGLAYGITKYSLHITERTGLQDISDDKLGSFFVRMQDISDDFAAKCAYALGIFVSRISNNDIKKCFTFSSKLPLAFVNSYYIGLGQGMRLSCWEQEKLKRLNYEIQSRGGVFWDYFCIGLGRWIAMRYPDNIDKVKECFYEMDIGRPSYIKQGIAYIYHDAKDF